MPTLRQSEALLCLPSGRSCAALRSALMAINVIPEMRPAGDAEGLRTLAREPRRVAFIDISHKATLPDLDRTLPRGPMRARVFLTRFEQGHVSAADRLWARKLGFAGLWAEFEPSDADGEIRQALDVVTATLELPPADPDMLTRQVSADRQASPNAARSTIRRIAGAGAESMAALLAKRLRIRDRSYHLREYPACFVGRAAVKAIAKLCACSAADAVAVGRALHELGLLVHVTHDHDFEDEAFFYRLAVSARADAVALDAALASLEQGLSIEDRSFHAKTYPRCWIGSDAVDLLVSRHSLERHQAWIVLHRLMQFGVFDHAVHERPFIDGHFFYRFAPVIDQRLAKTSQAAHRADEGAAGPLLPAW